MWRIIHIVLLESYQHASLPGCKQHTKVLVWIFSAQYGPGKNYRKYGKISQVLLEDSLGLHKISEKFYRNGFFLKFHIRISTRFGTKRENFLVKRMSIHPGKESNSFTHKRTFLSARTVMNKKIYCKSCGTSLGLKSQPKLNRHNDERLVKISDQNKQGVRRSKSQTESEQNRFLENKTSWLYFPVSFFCDFFMDVPPYLGANNIRKYLWQFFQRNTDPKKIAESMAKFHKFCYRIALVCTTFLKNSPEMVFSWNSA